MGIGLLWSPVLVAFLGVSDPVGQGVSDTASIEFLKSDGSPSTAQDITAQDTIVIEEISVAEKQAAQAHLDLDDKTIAR